MKLTKWGYGKFPKPQTAYIAVVVPAYIDGKIQYRWVTDIFYQGRKEWRAENHKKAYLFDKKWAEDFVTSLSWNGTAAWTVTVFPDCIPENNW
jgi:hypothetical protein